MKTKTIRKVINRHFDNFVKTIKDPRVRELVEKNTIVTGGAIASMLMQENPNDFDMYFRDADTVLAVANYYVDIFCEMYPDRAYRHTPGCGTGKGTALDVSDFRDREGSRRIKIIAKSAGIISEMAGNKEYAYFETRPDVEGQEYLDEVVPPVTDGEQYMEDVAAVVSATAAPPPDEEDEVIEDEVIEDEGMKDENKKDKQEKFRPIFLSANAITLSNDVQLIIRFFGEPEDIHANYDFVHCTNYWDSLTREVVLNRDALECILTRELRYIGSRYPLASLVRMRKFIKRGWSCHAGQILKMAMQTQELDLKDPIVLEEQLIGVDVAYFHQLIHRLRAENKPIDSIYIAELVDRIL